MKVSTRLCRATMFRSWPTGSLGLENHIPWARQDRSSRTIHTLWVRPVESGIQLLLYDVETNETGSGVVPRAARALFEKLCPPPSLTRNGSTSIRTPTRYSSNSIQTLSSLSKAGGDKDWQLHATYVEIYNEQLRDLLLPEDTPLNERNQVMIREDKGRILLTGLRQVAIKSVDDLLSALNFGSMIRQTEGTAINAQSSRSHAVFTLNLVQRKNTTQPTPVQDKRRSVPMEAILGNSSSWITIDSKLHFVDLAGSERLKNTGASGARAKEGISINAGLASLGHVIQQLSSRQAGSHVSYRDSKLTRLLQDSIGGNAITYMIACVTPPEFHLSETLNTVQYAQRARAIQSKPRIQQVSDDSDKQAAIERLRAEVSFLREQIKTSERGEHRWNAPTEKGERQNEREIELQNHLLDIQENYTALSQRHAKLISEIAKAKNDEPGPSDETSTLPGVVGESAVERLKRSNSFAEAVEQVVLEYEKTIQSLENSLSNTRSSLASTESSLLERETKCAFVETMNQQQEKRLQKLIDRESSTEHYLHDLEAKLDGRASGDEKSSEVMSELRKEIARVRENESANEDYISTLEERLAESDQDMELMQREIGRLEHVVERQRSLGKLDNLLYELDHIQANDHAPEDRLPNGVNGYATSSEKRSSARDPILNQAIQTAIPESDDEDGEHPPSMTPKPLRTQGEMSVTPKHTNHPGGTAAPPFERLLTEDYPAQSPAQSKFVAEKLESVTQELLDLRVEHETTVNDSNLLQAKYDHALQTLAQLQSAADSHRGMPMPPSHIPTVSNAPANFLGSRKINELTDGEGISSSRSLSSELSLAGDSPNTEQSDIENSQEKHEPGPLDRVMHKESLLTQEMDSLKRLHAEKEQTMASLQQRYAQLEDEHNETLDMVEELKTEVQKAKMHAPSSPTAPVIRRKSSQNMMTIDRAHRSLASLRNIATENFEANPDTMQNFELNLNTAMHELHQRSERVQMLEAELESVKKEMEMKMTIISGLTRERSSLQSSSPMDLSVVSSMRDKMLQSENQVRMMHETHAARERDLLDELDSLKAELAAHNQGGQSLIPGGFPETPMADDSVKELVETTRHEQDTKIAELENELSQWQEKHQKVTNSMKGSEKKMVETIAELEALVASVEVMGNKKSDDLQADFAKERIRHTETVEDLNKEIKGHKIAIGSHRVKVAELEQAHEDTQKQLEKERSTANEQLGLHREQITMLEEEVKRHQSDVEFHKHGLKSLHDSHARGIEEVRTNTLQRAQQEASNHVKAIVAQHENEVRQLREAKDTSSSEAVAGHEQRVRELQAAIAESEMAHATSKQQLHEHSSRLHDLEQDFNLRNSQLREAEEAKTAAEAKSKELTRINTETTKTLEELREKYDRSQRLVDELEKQIASTYDETQATSSRMSLMQTGRDQELHEARLAAAKAQEELDNYRTQPTQLEVYMKPSSLFFNPTNSFHRLPATDFLQSMVKRATFANPPP